MAIRRKHIRSLVEKLLYERHHIRKAPVPVDDIVESLGIQIKRDRVEDSLSGFLIRNTDTGGAVIGVNAGHHINRQRFTIAHELGHYLLHEGEMVHFDGHRPGYSLNLRSEQSSASDSELEREANLFAAELLMPVVFLERDLARIKKIDLIEDSTQLKKLADEYEVSVQALSFRLSYLGFIDL